MEKNLRQIHCKAPRGLKSSKDSHGSQCKSLLVQKVGKWQKAVKEKGISSREI